MSNSAIQEPASVVVDNSRRVPYGTQVMALEYSPLEYHRLMIGDTVRTRTYRDAIREVVKEGDVVLDLGTGTGLLANFACQAGASRVYAIDLNMGILEVARLVAEAQPYGSRITFYGGHSRNIELPEKVDVLVSEILGWGILDENISDLLTDARKRFLKPGGRSVPDSLNVYACAVEDEDLYDRVNFWGSDVYGIDFTPVRSIAENNPYIRTVEEKSVISDSQPIFESEILNMESSGFDSRIELKVTRKGHFHGTILWFRSRLSPSQTMENSPGSPPTHWQHIYFPVDNPVEVEAGTTIKVHFHGDALVQRLGFSYVWSWGYEVFKPGEKKATCECSLTTFRGFAMPREMKKEPKS